MNYDCLNKILKTVLIVGASSMYYQVILSNPQRRFRMIQVVQHGYINIRKVHMLNRTLLVHVIHGLGSFVGDLLGQIHGITSANISLTHTEFPLPPSLSLPLSQLSHYTCH